MTCQELNLRLDEVVRNASPRNADREAAAAHLASCPDCRRLFAERTELETNLKLVRDSALLPSEQLDTRIVANYRQFMSERTSASKTTFSRPAILAWAAFAAATVLVVVALLVRRPQTMVATPTQDPAPQTVSVSPSSQRMDKITTIQAKQPTPARHIAKPRHRSTAAPDQTPAAAEVVHLLPEDFRRLMYCDELSCAQDMDMIRVQLPSAFATRPGRNVTQPGGLINADVLVGPDGIARGIRFEQ